MGVTLFQIVSLLIYSTKNEHVEALIGLCVINGVLIVLQIIIVVYSSVFKSTSLVHDNKIASFILNFSTISECAGGIDKRLFEKNDTSLSKTYLLAASIIIIIFSLVNTVMVSLQIFKVKAEKENSLAEKREISQSKQVEDEVPQTPIKGQGITLGIDDE